MCYNKTRLRPLASITPSCAALIVVACHSLLFADVTIVERVRTGDVLGLGRLNARKVVQVHGSNSREEFHPRGTGKLRQAFDPLDDAVVLILTHQGVIRKLDAANQVYEEIPLKDWFDYLAQQPRSQAAQNTPTVHLTSAFKIQPTTQVKRIRGHKAKRYSGELKLSSEAGLARSDVRLVLSIWSTPNDPTSRRAQQEVKAFQQAYLAKMGAPLSPEDLRRFGAHQVGRILNIDQKDLESFFKNAEEELKKIEGFPIEERADWYIDLFKEGKPIRNPKIPRGKPVMTTLTDLESISFKPIPPRRFQVPSRYNLIGTYSIPTAPSDN